MLNPSSPDSASALAADPVAARFSAMAQRYEDAAQVQAQAADAFDGWLDELDLPAPGHIAEIGCGTGLFTRLLQERHPDASLCVTDLALEMVAHCRARFGPAPRLSYRVCDGRSAIFTPEPDWIVSTMCFQWFDPLLPVLRHHLAQSRVLAFSVVLNGSFSAWRGAHARAGLQPGLRPLPGYEPLRQACSSLGVRVSAKRITLIEHHANGLEFAHSLRAIGADFPRHGHQPQNLRPVLRQLDKGLESNYEIGFFCLQK